MFRFTPTWLLAIVATMFSVHAGGFMAAAYGSCPPGQRPPGGCPHCDCPPHRAKMGCCCCSNCCCDGPYMRPIARAQWYNWNRNYAHTEYGQPIALVVPPTANMQTNYGWGVASSRISRIDHQFQRNYPGGGTFGGPFRPTPIWPSDTIQFGVYPVRGPW